MKRFVHLLLIVALTSATACNSDPLSSPADTSLDTDAIDSNDSSNAADLENDSDIDADRDGIDDSNGEDLDADMHLQDAADTPADTIVTDAPDATPTPNFLTCMGRPLEHEIEGVWVNPRRSELLESMTPGHSVEDLIVTMPAAPFQVEGQFAYGDLSIDLESEWVTAFVDNCTEWVEIGRRETDSDGRVPFDVPPSALVGPGRFEVRMFVEGDGTTAIGNLLLVPPDTRFVVFDIDGTLTTGDSELFIELFSDLFGGDYVPDAYPNADAITLAYSEMNYEIIYLTGRPYWLDDVSRQWLVDGGFPVGTVHFTRTLSESMPNDGGVGEYKRDYLLGIAADHVLFRGYGNATTDIFGFREAGMSTDDIYIIGDNAGEEGTQAIVDYATHLGAIEIPPAEQPWEDD